MIRVKFQELIIGRNEEAFRRHNDENVQRDSTKEEKEASQQRQAWRSLGGFFSTGIIDSLPGVSVSYEEHGLVDLLNYHKFTTMDKKEFKRNLKRWTIDTRLDKLCDDLDDTRYSITIHIKIRNEDLAVVSRRWLSEPNRRFVNPSTIPNKNSFFLRRKLLSSSYATSIQSQ